VTPGTPLSVLFPLANILGSIVGPTVKAAIGADNEERLDKLADNLCVLVQSRSPQKCPILHIAWNFTDVDRFLLLSNSQQEPAGQRGICQELLQALRDLAQEATPAGQVKKYNCLLNLLCVWVLIWVQIVAASWLLCIAVPALDPISMGPASIFWPEPIALPIGSFRRRISSVRSDFGLGGRRLHLLYVVLSS
jgi:hypothetical protein